MTDNVGFVNNEKSLYLMQIQYLEEQLERFQLKCDELEEQKSDLSCQCSALEKEKKDITDYLKSSLAMKEKKIDMLKEQLETQRQEAKQDRQALNLQQTQQMQSLQEHISKLHSQSMIQAAMIESQKAPQIEVMQQMQYVESLKKKLDSQVDEHKAAINNLMMETALEKEHWIEDLQDKANSSVIIKNEGAQCRKNEKMLQFLHRKNGLLQEENEVIQGKQRDLCAEWENLQEDLKKIEQENVTCRKKAKQLSDSCKQLKVKIKKLRIVHQHKVAHLKDLRQCADRLVKECREKAKEASQLLHEIQEERIKQKKLEGIMREAASILRPVLDSGTSSETQWKVQKLLEILESTAGQGTASTLSKSTEKKVGGRKPQASRVTSVRKLWSQTTSTTVDPSDQAPQPRPLQGTEPDSGQ